jgi:hypothetical protein
VQRVLEPAESYVTLDQTGTVEEWAVWTAGICAQVAAIGARGSSALTASMLRHTVQAAVEALDVAAVPKEPSAVTAGLASTMGLVHAQLAAVAQLRFRMAPPVVLERLNAVLETGTYKCPDVTVGCALIEGPRAAAACVGQYGLLADGSMPVVRHPTEVCCPRRYAFAAQSAGVVFFVTYTSFGGTVAERDTEQPIGCIITVPVQGGAVSSPQSWTLPFVVDSQVVQTAYCDTTGAGKFVKLLFFCSAANTVAVCRTDRPAALHNVLLDGHCIVQGQSVFGPRHWHGLGYEGEDVLWRTVCLEEQQWARESAAQRLGRSVSWLRAAQLYPGPNPDVLLASLPGLHAHKLPIGSQGKHDLKDPKTFVLLVLARGHNDPVATVRGLPASPSSAQAVWDAGSGTWILVFSFPGPRAESVGMAVQTRGLLDDDVENWSVTEERAADLRAAWDAAMCAAMQHVAPDGDHGTSPACSVSGRAERGTLLASQATQESLGEARGKAGPMPTPGGDPPQAREFADATHKAWATRIQATVRTAVQNSVKAQRAAAESLWICLVQHKLLSGPAVPVHHVDAALAKASTCLISPSAHPGAVCIQSFLNALEKDDGYLTPRRLGETIAATVTHTAFPT